MSPIRLTISEVADLLGVAPRTIRHYHEIGVLPEPVRGDNGYRLYSGADLRNIQRIRELQAFGLSLRQIGFVLQADEPDLQLRAFLVQRDRELAEELSRLQQQQARVRAFLRGERPQSEPTTPAHEILHGIIRPASNGLADVIVAVEREILAEIDRLPHDDHYARFWEEVATLFARTFMPHEHLVILWFERYLALADMTHDDRQAQAWLQELRATSSASVLLSALDLPKSDAMPAHEQLQIRRLIPALLYEHATPLQKAFIATLQQGSGRR